jgi:hypothetical protein
MTDSSWSYESDFFLELSKRIAWRRIGVDQIGTECFEQRAPDTDCTRGEADDKFKSLGDPIMATTSVFAGTGFVEFQCDCGAAFGDSVHGSITHVLQAHCSFEQRENMDLLRNRVVTLISPNVLDFLSEDLDLQ